MSAKSQPPAVTSEALDKIKCGVIMPISPIDNCPASHWAEVLEIIKESLDSSKFAAEIVSSSADTTIIHKTIVKNVYENEIVICDISARNPNVMLELGMRLAFDKPVVVIKDDATPYSFDTSPIEHLEYPRDLRFAKIKTFKTDLCKKVIATHEANKPGSSFFLKDYPLYKTASLPEEQASALQVVLAEMAEIKSSIGRLPQAVSPPEPPRNRHSYVFTVKTKYAPGVSEILRSESRIVSVLQSQRGDSRIAVTLMPGESLEGLKQHIDGIVGDIEIPF